MGQRANARGLDLNRDFIKLEAPETRGLVQVSQRVEPSSLHRHPYDQRFAPPLHDHLRGPEEPGRRSQGHRLHAADVLPRGERGIREADGPESVLLREFQPRPHAVDDLSGRGPVRHDLCGAEEPAVGPLGGVCVRPLQDARAGHTRLRARLPADGREPQGGDRQAAGPSAAKRRRARQPVRARRPASVPIRSRAKRGQGPVDGPRLSSSARKTAGGSRPTLPRTTRCN